MHASSPLLPSCAQRWLAVLAAALATALMLHGPIAQWAAYHAFADTRSWFCLPNAENVLSNLPFALIGIWGWRISAGAPAWRCFSAALVLTAFGSALYHWSPDNLRLVFDRLPIAWACASLLCAFLGERVDAGWASPRVLMAALVAATASVLWWWAGEQVGHGDLRPYLFIQFLPMLIVPAAMLLRLPARPDSASAADAHWWTVLALYAAAKLMESADAGVLHALGFISGHTMKHLLAAAAALVLLRGVATRRQLR